MLSQLLAKLNSLVSVHNGHPAELLSNSFNPWNITRSKLLKKSSSKDVAEIRRIANNSHKFQIAVASLGLKHGVVSALYAADVNQLEDVVSGLRMQFDSANQPQLSAVVGVTKKSPTWSCQDRVRERP